MKKEDFYCYGLVKFIIYAYVIGITVFCVVIAICGIISLPWLISTESQAVVIGIIIGFNCNGIKEFILKGGVKYLELYI